MKILMVSSESVPFSKSGGLADVVGALSSALNNQGHDCRIVIPAYNMSYEKAGEKVCSITVKIAEHDEEVEVRLNTVGKTKYYMLCHPMYNDRLGIYGDSSFEPYSDNFERFTLMCKVVLELCPAIQFKPDIVHCHDWTAGLLPYFLKTEKSRFFTGSKTVFTIHNLAYQGTFPRLSFLLCGVKPSEKLFSDNKINMLQAGLTFSDFITTVSPTYAKEIQTPQQGCGLDSILTKRKSRLKGIINGIDTEEWNPLKDKEIPLHFSKSDFTNKAKLKELIQQQFNLPVQPETPLFAMISRLAGQKGFDALTPCLEDILSNNNLQFVIIGTGDRHLENTLLDMASRHDNLSVNIMFSNKAAHLVEAGSDFFLMPSRYEPCGLNQLYSLRYGTLPIARRTGGLADTIVDLDENPCEGTGILFDELTPENITAGIERALKHYQSGELKKIRARAMSQDFSWSSSADEYIKIFERIKVKQ